MTLSRWIAFIAQVMIGSLPIFLIMDPKPFKRLLSRLMRSGR